MGVRGLGAGAITTVGAVAIFFVARLATAGVSSSDSALAGLALLDPLSVGVFMRERDGLEVLAAEVGFVWVAVSVAVAVAVAVCADAADEGNHSRTVMARPTLTGDR
ncbi:MAG: hypothetical protein DWI10_09160 [Planctomycetota bacterium]|nr:MAG: hypothetical protein DWI10_09160 [Planctomycetota bacterium]